MVKLGLGTVQFGLDYGVANAAGKTPAEEVRRILEEAQRSGLRILDTASLYGDSEEAIGRSLPAGHSFRIVTKTAKFPGGFGPVEARSLEATFEASRRKLGMPGTYGLMVHDADDLLGPDGHRLKDALLGLKARGLVAKVGASVYSPAQVDALLSRWAVDIIQIPFNAFDQRLIRGGQLKALKSAGVEVHARSVFLQGVLLMDPDRLPAFLNAARPLVERFRRMAASAGLSPLEAALAYVTAQDGIDHFLVGVCDRAQLMEILAAAGSGKGVPDLSGLHCDDERIVNPALWIKG